MTEIEASGGAVHWLTRDGIRIRTASWPGAGGGTVLLLHGRTEFMEKYLETVATLQRRGFAVWTLDWRGQGRSTRLLPDPALNHVQSFEDYLADLDTLISGLIEPALVRPFVILGQSMGGHLALRLLARRPGLFARAVLASPMVDFPRPHRMSRRAARLLAVLACAVPGMAGRHGPGTARVPDPGRAFEGNPLTSCSRRFALDQAGLEQSDLVVGGATWGWLRAATGSIATMHRASFAPSVTTPVLMVLAGTDRIVDNAAARSLARKLPHASVAEIEGARHELLREADAYQTRFWAEFDGFVRPRAY